jgi:hypothetical protein
LDARSEIQEVALEIIPAACSIAESIRVMIREGYLVSAIVLFRPLLERVATLCYLERYAEAVELWRSGWEYKTRPSLKMRMSAMMPGAPHGLLDNFVASASQYNGMIHGDPAAAGQSITRVSDEFAYVTGRDYNAPERASNIALEVGVVLAFLIARSQIIFDLA